MPLDRPPVHAVDGRSSVSVMTIESGVAAGGHRGPFATSLGAPVTIAAEP
jgi:hypothetical protein